MVTSCNGLGLFENINFVLLSLVLFEVQYFSSIFLLLLPSYYNFITILHKFRVFWLLHTKVILRIKIMMQLIVVLWQFAFHYNDNLARKSLTQLAPRPVNGKNNKYLCF